MTNEEAKKILSEYVKACNEDDFFTLEMFEYEKVIEAMAMGAKALSIPSLPSNLDEAAERYSCYDEDCEGAFYEPIVRNAFKAGAEWTDAQGEEAEVGYWNQTGLSVRLDKSLERLGFEEGDKVMVYIRKA